MSNKTRNLFTLIIISLCAGIIYQVPYLKAVFYDALQTALGVSHTDLGSLNSIYGIAAMILYIPGGIVADKIRMKYLFPVSMVACGLLVFWYATIPPLRTLQIIHLLLAVFSILTFWSARVKIVRYLSDEKSFPVNQGISNSLYAFAAMACSFAALSFISHATGSSVQGLRAALIFYGFAYTGFGIISFFCIPKFDDEIDTSSKFHIHEFISAIKMPGVWVMAFSMFVIYAIQISIPYTTPYLTNVYLAPAVLISAISIVRSYGINFVSAPISGLIAKKIGSAARLVVIYSICTIVLVALFLLIPVNPNLVGLVIALSIVCAFFATAMNGIAMVQMAEAGVPKKLFGGASGVVSVIGYLPDVFIYTLYGTWLDKYTGHTGYNRIFIFVIALAVVSIFISMIVAKKGKSLRGKVEADASATAEG